MIRSVFRSIPGRFAVAAGLVLAVFVLSGASAPATAPNVTYTAAGTFASTPTSGADTLRLAGEPFTISIVASTASQPKMHGPNWAVLTPFKMTGQVHSGLLGPTPITIASSADSILQMLGPQWDLFQTAFPVKVVGISLTINANIYMPPNWIPNALIHPFNPVALTPSNATVTYSDGGVSTVLAVNSGTLTAVTTSKSK